MLGVVSRSVSLIWAGVLLLGALSAVVLISLPIYHDHAIYWRGGEQLLYGKLGNDYLVKQPGIYAVFAAAKLLWGDHEWSYRLLDALLQVLAATLLGRIALHIRGTPLAATTAGVYMLTYTANAFVLGSHPESYTGIFTALIALVRIRYQPGWYRAIVEGIVLAAALWLKITFVCVGAGLLLLDIMQQRNWRMITTYWLIAGTTAFLVSALGLAFLWQRIDWSAIPATIEYLRFYAQTPPLGLTALSDAWHRVLRSASEHFSIAWVGAAIIGWLQLLRRRNSIIELWATVTLALAASIVLERKFGVVHLWRMLSVLSIPIAAGLLDSARVVRMRWNQTSSVLRGTVLIPMLVIGVLLTPIPRFIQLLRTPLDALIDQSRYNAAFQRPAHNVLHRQTLWDVTGFIQSHRHAKDRVLLLSACMSQLYLFVGEPQWYHFSTTLPIYASHVPQQWRTFYEADFRAADWIVISTLDRAEWLFGHQRSSWESLCHDAWSANYLAAHFTQVLETDIALVFRRVKPDVQPSP